jgi:hypothetical protein
MGSLIFQLGFRLSVQSNASKRTFLELPSTCLGKIQDRSFTSRSEYRGGKFLLSIQLLPQNTYATETFPSNVSIAKSRLTPLSVQVIEAPTTEHLPFKNGSFDLIINRHGDINAPEIYRILKSGQSFVTQQVGGRNHICLHEILQDKGEF